MQGKMMLENIQHTFYYWVICRDFKQSNILPALLLYAQCFLSGFKKNPIPPVPPSLCCQLLWFQSIFQLVLLTRLSCSAIFCCLSQTTCCHKF